MWPRCPAGRDLYKPDPRAAVIEVALSPTPAQRAFQVRMPGDDDIDFGADPFIEIAKCSVFRFHVEAAIFLQGLQSGSQHFVGWFVL